MPRRRGLTWLVLALWLLAGCRAPGSTLPVIKVGLIAPFEGEHRQLGYDVHAAALLAVREWNEQTRLRGWGVELVAVDDGLDPGQTVGAAGKLAVDPDVVAVIGLFSAETSAAALPVLAAAGIPTLALAPVPNALLAARRPLAVRFFPSPWPGVDAATYEATRLATSAGGELATAAFAEAYRAATGNEPGLHAALTYDAARTLLQALAVSIRQHGRPTRASIAEALPGLRLDGLAGAIEVQPDGTVGGLSPTFAAR